MSRNINAFKNLTAKMNDLDDFLAGVISAISCVGYVDGRCGGGGWMVQ